MLVGPALVMERLLGSLRFLVGLCVGCLEDAHATRHRQLLLCAGTLSLYVQLQVVRGIDCFPNVVIQQYGRAYGRGREHPKTRWGPILDKQTAKTRR